MKSMNKLLWIVFIGFGLSLFAQEPAKLSKEEMKQNLDKFVKENREASVGIEPLIEKVREILSSEKKPVSDPVKK
jgi:hypothetical protein